ncbi:hypothetical protein AB1Y20_019391 [Prymnesium parvum]|uniref:Myosin motor domain-containing protein n=1 Tax=Prymnesium parvum TaxID=97485 RepID=A0AB34JTZ3_PRYPA
MADKAAALLPAAKEEVRPPADEVEVLVPTDDEAVGWRRATLLQQLPGGAALVLLGGARHELRAAALSVVSTADVDDVASLPHLGEPQLVDALRRRFERGVIYTACGPSLLAVNPWRQLPLYTDEQLARYGGVASGAPHAPAGPPHVFGVAAVSLRAVREERTDQTIVVSGESGAGKSKSARLLLQALVGFTSHAAAAHAAADGLGQKLLLAIEVLEPFGSAQTRRNPHSSRFGRMMSLSVEQGGGGAPTIRVACVECYLLERSRVTHAPHAERLFHLVVGVAAPERELLRLANSSADYAYLKPCPAPSAEAAQLTEALARTRSALEALCSADQALRAIRVVSAVLLLGNITFQARHGGDGVEVGDRGALEQAAAQAELGADELEAALCRHALEIRGERVLVHHTVEQASRLRDALATTLYCNLFAHLTHAVNESMRADEADGAAACLVSILDMFGFECFDSNSLEQLLINYANEKLQAQFIAVVLKLEEQEYEREGLEWDAIGVGSHSDAPLRLIEDPMGILSLLEEQARLEAGSDERFCRALNTHHEKHAGARQHAAARAALRRLTAPAWRSAGMLPLRMQRPPGEFCVRHYAGPVTYHAAGFLEKSREEVPPALAALLASSRSSFVQQLSSAPASAAATRGVGLGSRPSRMPRGGGSRASMFKQQLSGLVRRMAATRCHYVRCVNPRQERDAATPRVFPSGVRVCARVLQEAESFSHGESVPTSTTFHATRVLRQLRSLGTVQAVQIARAGYPHRMSPADFASRFGSLLGLGSGKRDDASIQSACADMLQATALGAGLALTQVGQIGRRATSCHPRTAQRGPHAREASVRLRAAPTRLILRPASVCHRTKVFLTRRALELLEEAKAGRERGAALTLQRAARARRRRAAAAAAAAATKLNATARGRHSRARWRAARAAAALMVRCARGFVGRRVVRALLERRRRESEAARRLQALARAWMFRRAMERRAAKRRQLLESRRREAASEVSLIGKADEGTSGRSTPAGPTSPVSSVESTASSLVTMKPLALKGMGSATQGQGGGLEQDQGGSQKHARVLQEPAEQKAEEVRAKAGAERERERSQLRANEIEEDAFISEMARAEAAEAERARRQAEEAEEAERAEWQAREAARQVQRLPGAKDSLPFAFADVLLMPTAQAAIDREREEQALVRKQAEAALERARAEKEAALQAAVEAERAEAARVEREAAKARREREARERAERDAAVQLELEREKAERVRAEQEAAQARERVARAQREREAALAQERSHRERAEREAAAAREQAARLQQEHEVALARAREERLRAEQEALAARERAERVLAEREAALAAERAEREAAEQEAARREKLRREEEEARRKAEARAKEEQEAALARERAEREHAEQQAALAQARAERVHAEQQARLARERAERELAEQEAALASERAYRLQLEHEAALEAERARKLQAEREAVMAAELAGRSQAEKESQLQRERERERAERERAEREREEREREEREREEREREERERAERERAELEREEREREEREREERARAVQEAEHARRAPVRAAAVDCEGACAADAPGVSDDFEEVELDSVDDGVEYSLCGACASPPASATGAPSTSLAITTVAVQATPLVDAESSSRRQADEEARRRAEEEIRSLRRSLEQERAAVAVLEGSHRQLTAMLRETHSRDAQRSSGSHPRATGDDGRSGASAPSSSTLPPPTSRGVASGRSTTSNGWLASPSPSPAPYSASKPRAGFVRQTPTTPPPRQEPFASSSLATYGAGLFTPPTARQAPQQWLPASGTATVFRSGGITLSQNDAPLVPLEAIAASAALQEEAAPHLRALMQPVPLFALNSPAHRQRVQSQIAESAREANTRGEFSRAAELFERANSVLPSNTLLISALNMKLKSGQPSVALAGYGRALRLLSLTDSQREHVQRKMCEAFQAYSSLLAERALLLMQARLRLGLHRRRRRRAEQLLASRMDSEAARNAAVGRLSAVNGNYSTPSHDAASSIPLLSTLESAHRLHGTTSSSQLMVLVFALVVGVINVVLVCYWPTMR